MIFHIFFVSNDSGLNMCNVIDFCFFVVVHLISTKIPCKSVGPKLPPPKFSPVISSFPLDLEGLQIR